MLSDSGLASASISHNFPLSVGPCLAHKSTCMLEERTLTPIRAGMPGLPKLVPCLLSLSPPCVLCTPSLKQSSKCSVPAHVAVGQGQKAGSRQQHTQGLDGEEPCKVGLEPESKYKGSTKPSPGHRLPPLTDAAGDGIRQTARIQQPPSYSWM